MTVNINAGNISGIRLAEQGSDPSTPASGYGQLYAKADGLYFIGDDGVVEGPMNPGVAARYSTAAGQSIADQTTTIVDFGTISHDTHTAVTTGAAWKFTVPAGFGGVYSVSANVLFTNTTAWDANESGNLMLFKNGVQAADLDSYQPTAFGVAHYVGLNGKTDILLVAGDYIDIRVAQATGGALALFNSASFNHVSIHRVA